MKPVEDFSEDMINYFLRNSLLNSIMFYTDHNADEQESKHSTQFWEREKDERGREH